MKIAINLISFKRPQTLQLLLEGLTGQQFSGPAPSLQVILVDNDEAGSAQAVAAAFASRLQLHYVVEPQQGIPLARNRALATTPPDTDFIALIDDDEVPSPFWLDQLLKTQRETQAPFVRGPVQPHFPEGAPAWVLQGGFFNRPTYAQGQVVQQGASNNALLSLKAIRQHQLSFSEALRYTGGSDHLFFLQAHKAGLQTVWASQAIVTEHNPARRATFRWLLRRQFRLGNTLAIAERMLEATPATFLRRCIKCAGRAALGLLQLGLVLRDGRVALARAAFSLARAGGMLVGLLGIRVQEYHPNRL